MSLTQNQITDLVFADVTAAEAAGRPNEICYVQSMDTFYNYVVSGSAYTVDHTTVLSTGNGGDTRWIARSGQHSHATYTKTVRVPASKLGLPNTNPPAVVEFGITHAIKFTVDTDRAKYKQAVESDYDSGDINVHFHWTKSTTNSDQSGKKVKWQLKYLVINGTSENCNSGEATLSIEDTYDSAVLGTQIVYQTGEVTIPDGAFETHDMIIMELMAVTPSANALDDEPAILWCDVVYTAKHIPE